MNPSKAEFKSSFQVVFFMRLIFFPVKITIDRIKADVNEAIVSIGRTSRSLRLILNAVGTVDQNNIASNA